MPLLHSEISELVASLRIFPEAYCQLRARMTSGD